MTANNKSIGKIIDNEELLMSLADNMAATATTFNGHGYDAFLQARQQFKDTLHTIIINSEDIRPDKVL